MIYETDFYGWTQQQAALLKDGRLNLLDLTNIIEEIESMGRSEKRELQSRLTILLLHLLKWKFQPSKKSRSWRLSIDEQRIQFLDVLKENPSLKPRLNDILEDAYRLAIVKAAKETKLSKKDFPSICPWNWEEIMDSEFYPN
ncbi:MAG: DUF29 domain-containing protein [Methylococcales bacterium]|nr:DUF29 domain-containing protein [Methylococcales bacterium]